MVAEPIVTPADDANTPPAILESRKVLKDLGDRLDKRATRIKRYEEYYDGTQRLAFATSKFRQAFGGLFGAFADNICDLVVDAVEERLDVEGFRIGPGEKAGLTSLGKPKIVGGDKAGDTAAWEMWQRNELDAYSQIAHNESLVKEISYVCVGPGEKDAKVPLITVESPYTTIVAYAAGSYQVRKVALKRWIDDDGFQRATLYWPDRIEKYITRDKVDAGGSLTTPLWTPRQDDGEDWPLRHGLGVVPIVPLINRPRLDGTGRSELKSVLPIQDAINKLVMDMIVASEFSAYRQRYATGIEIEIDEQSGEPTEQFQANIARLWASENQDAKFGTLEASDLSPFVAGVEMLIQHVASETRTPYHYFLQHGGQPPSGESLRASEAGLVFKSRRKQRYFGEGWEEVIRIGFLQSGDKARGSIEATETIWRDPETRSESAHIDGLTKLASIGVPEEQLWEDAGYSPTQIARFLEMRAREPQVPLLKQIEKTAPATVTAPATRTFGRNAAGMPQITRTTG